MTPPFCPHCGKQHPPTARFCVTTGKAILAGVAQVSVTPNSPFGQANQYPYTSQTAISSGNTGLLPSNTFLQGRYVIQHKIGHGGMAAVYRAVDTRTNATLAIKEMSDSVASATPQEHADALQAFHQEAYLLATLQHSNLPRVSDSFEANNKHYLVMEYIEGDTLERMLERRGYAFSEGEVVPLAVQLCEVLSYLHDRQPPIIFRDLKPSNIMLTPNGRVKLIDFGIARYFKTGKSTDTQALGTLGYAAPEVLRREQSEPRSDIYSLCVTLLELLTGIDPGDYVGRALPAVRSVNPSISVEMERILQCGLQLDKTQRFANAAMLREALCALPVSTGGGQVGMAVKRTSRPTTRLLMAAVKLHPAQLATALLAIVGFIVVAAWLLAPALRASGFDWNLVPIFAVFGPLGFAAYPKRGMAILSHSVLTSTLVWTISARLDMWFTIEATLLAVLASGALMEFWLLLLPKIKGPGGQEAWKREVAWYGMMGIPAMFVFYLLLGGGAVGMNPLGWLIGGGLCAAGWFLGDLIYQGLLYRQTGVRQSP